MASRDLFHNIRLKNAIDPTAIRNANAAVVSAIIDTQGYESLTFAIEAGVITDGTLTPSLQESDDPGMAGSNAVATADLLGTIAAATFAITDDSVTKTIGYKGSKRYVTITVTQAGATTGGFYSAVAIQGHSRNNPGNTSAAPSP